MPENILDTLIGDEGFKADVSVSLNPKVYIPIGATMVVSIIIGMVLGNMINKILN